MPTVRGWYEETAPGVWIAEVEIGFPKHRFKALRAGTHDEMIGKLSETYREFTEPSDKEKRKAAAAEAARPTARIEEPWPEPGTVGERYVAAASGEYTIKIDWNGTSPLFVREADLPVWLAAGYGLAAEPADAPDAPEAPEAAETETGHQAVTAEAPMENMTAPNMGAAYDSALNAANAPAPSYAEPVRQKRQYRKRQKAE